jgi:hypothetical protein
MNWKWNKDMARRKWRSARLLKGAFFFVAGSLLVGFLTIFFERFFGFYVPKHFSVSLGVGLAVATVLWLLRLVKHPPLLMKNVPPLVAGFCAGLGVHLARFWLK